MRRADVLIIGGGIMGASAALDIVLRSNLSVLLLEKTVCGSQSSQANFGNVRFYDWSKDQMPIAIRARRIWENLERLLGTDGEFRQTGSVRVTFQQSELDGLAAYMKTAAGYDFGFEILDKGQLKARFPWLHGSIGAMWSPRDGTCNPRLVAAAFAVAAAKAGVEIVEHAEVVTAERPDRDFVVKTRDGRSFGAPILVNCAGAWANGIAEQFGEIMPMSIEGPQLAVTEPLPQFVKSMMSCFGNFYFRQTERGNVLMGGFGRNAAEIETSLHSVMPDNIAKLYRRLVELVPKLNGIRLIRTWSGVEGYTPDLLPVIGASRTTPGLIHAFGFSGSGFQLGPGVGEILSELVRDGKSATSVDGFRIDRPRPEEIDRARLGVPLIR